MSDCVGREPWVHLFAAQPRELSELRRMLKIRLILWGLPDHVEVAQLCVSELVTNVIRHIGEGTPATLRMGFREPYLRLEVEDPDTRALPTLLAAGSALESGRGMALVDALTDHRWGVFLREDSKVVWCELATTDEPAIQDQKGGPGGARAEALLNLYGLWQPRQNRALFGERSMLSEAVAEEAAIGVMADLLHWLHAHGYDPDDVLDRAQTHFEAAINEVV